MTLRDLVEITKRQWEAGLIKPWPENAQQPFKLLLDKENEIIEELKEEGLSIEGMREEQLAGWIRELKRIHGVP